MASLLSAFGQQLTAFRFHVWCLITDWHLVYYGPHSLLKLEATLKFCNNLNGGKIFKLKINPSNFCLLPGNFLTNLLTLCLGYAKTVDNHTLQFSNFPVSLVLLRFQQTETCLTFRLPLFPCSGACWSISNSVFERVLTSAAIHFALGTSVSYLSLQLFESRTFPFPQTFPPSEISPTGHFPSCFW